MTTIVGVLNSRGVAFAADSAATHTTKDNKYKIKNHTNKIFTLSKYHPVGVAIYENLDFEGIPWETIIKMFRNNLKDKKYNTIDQYIKEFWAYIKKECLILSVNLQQANLNMFLRSYYQEVHSQTEMAVGKYSVANAVQYYQHYISVLDNRKSTYQRQIQAEDFKTYDLKQFRKYAKLSVDKILTNDLADPNCPVEFRKKFEESAHAFLCVSTPTYFSNYTGLVFWGYGDSELFPSYQEYRVYYAIDNHIKYNVIDKYAVTGLGCAAVKPFAQRDVASSIIWAVEDTLKSTFYENYKKSIEVFRDDIIRQMTNSGASQQLIDILNGLDANRYAINYRDSMNKYIEEHFINPLTGTIAYLSKEDLADMAESIVRMTCIKRRITSTEETVGGPVDVAVVTKGDGFIWMHRKHYFDPQLNQQFFERYNK